MFDVEMIKNIPHLRFRFTAVRVFVFMTSRTRIELAKRVIAVATSSL